MTRQKFHAIVERVFELDRNLDNALKMFPPLDQDEIDVVNYLRSGQLAKSLYTKWLEAQTQVTDNYNKLNIK